MTEDTSSALTDQMVQLLESKYGLSNTREEASLFMSTIMQKIRNDIRKERLSADSRVKNDIDEGRIAPSSISWNKIEAVSLVPSFESFVMDIEKVEIKYQIPPISDTEMKAKAASVNETTQLVLRHCASRNEAYSLIAASNLLAFVVYCFDKLYSSEFTFKVLPVVFSCPSDHRKDKDSDYVLVRLKNQRTITVIELKSSVSSRIGDGDRDSIAQLIYEVKLTCQEEKKYYSDVIAIYGNFHTWHLFWMDFSLATKKVKGYLVISEIDPLTLCSALHHIYDRFN